MADKKVFELNCGAQSYDWGKLGKDGSKVAKFAQGTRDFKYDEEKPYAELWMGTHPSMPSTLAGTGESLKDLLEKRPELCGEQVVKQYGKDLPFLFKVLAIRKALSIQAHPDKGLAKRLHKEKPDVYKDDNHKPEMAIALTPFSGFCGFRPPKQIATFLSAVPEFAAVCGDATSSFRKTFGEGQEGSAEEKKEGLKAVFGAVMRADESLIKKQASALLERLSQGSRPDGIDPQEVELIKTLDRDFPQDVGIFCTFLLNIVRLKPGEAVFLKANEPHAYLDGDIMECMATSDNVVRAGLTPKLRDVPTLTSMLTYTSSPPDEQLLPASAPFRSSQHSRLYDPPIDEFSVLLTDLAKGESEKIAGLKGPSILIVTRLEGGQQASLHSPEGAVDVVREGQVFFVAAGTELEIRASDGPLTAYRAFVEAKL